MSKIGNATAVNRTNGTSSANSSSAGDVAQVQRFFDLQRHSKSPNGNKTLASSEKDYFCNPPKTNFDKILCSIQ